jgi:hypothetical protein
MRSRVASAAVLVWLATVASCTRATTPAANAPDGVELAPVIGELEQITPHGHVALALISLHNRSAKTQRVLRFRLRWPGGSLLVKPRQLSVPAGETLETALRIGADAGEHDAHYAAPRGTPGAGVAVAQP